MTDSPTTQPSGASDRERQLAAAKVLVELIAADSMPVLSWDLSAYQPGILGGYVPSDQSDEKRRGDVAFWADLLEVDVTERDGGDKRGPWTDVIASGTYRDVSMKVWTRIYGKDVSA